MSNAKSEAAEKKNSPPPRLPSQAREVRLKSTIRLPGIATDWFTTDPEKARAGGRVVVKTLAVSSWGITILGGEKQFSEPVVNVPWTQVEYWIPA